MRKIILFIALIITISNETIAQKTDWSEWTVATDCFKGLQVRYRISKNTVWEPDRTYNYPRYHYEFEIKNNYNIKCAVSWAFDVDGTNLKKSSDRTTIEPGKSTTTWYLRGKPTNNRMIWWFERLCFSFPEGFDYCSSNPVEGGAYFAECDNGTPNFKIKGKNEKQNNNNNQSNNVQSNKATNEISETKQKNSTSTSFTPSIYNGDLVKLIERNLNCPSASKNLVTLKLNITVNADGSLVVEPESVGKPDFEKEAKRVFLLTKGNWTPASQNGQSVIDKKVQKVTFNCADYEAPDNNQNSDKVTSTTSATKKTVNINSSSVSSNNLSLAELKAKVIELTKKYFIDKEFYQYDDYKKENKNKVSYPIIDFNNDEVKIQINTEVENNKSFTYNKALYYVSIEDFSIRQSRSKDNLFTLEDFSNRKVKLSRCEILESSYMDKKDYIKHDLTAPYGQLKNIYVEMVAWLTITPEEWTEYSQVLVNFKKALRESKK